MKTATAKKAKTIEILEPEVAVTLDLVSNPGGLLQQIEESPKAIVTDRLVSVYSFLKKIEKRATGIKSKIKDELLTRLDSAKPYGKENQHREFISGSATIKAEKSVRTSLNLERATAFVEKKKLNTEVCDLVIEEGYEELQHFLKKNKKQVREMGLKLREEINQDKLADLVTKKVITTDEFESLLDKKEVWSFKD